MTALENLRSTTFAYQTSLGADHRLVKYLQAALALNSEDVARDALAYADRVPPAKERVLLTSLIHGELLEGAKATPPQLSLVLTVTPNSAPIPGDTWSDAASYSVSPDWSYQLARKDAVTVIAPGGSGLAGLQRAAQWVNQTMRDYLSVNNAESAQRILFAKAQERFQSKK